MTQPKVTVITATYNLIRSDRKEVFYQCIKSLQAQDYPNIEHLIIDGASTDGSTELFDKLGLNYVSEPDLGISDAYNKGVKKAQGKYIFFLNSDDYLTRPDSISSCVKKLEKEQADFTYGNHINVDKQGNEKLGYKDDRLNFKNIFFGMPFCHSSVLMKKSTIEECGGFDTKYRISADYKLILKAFLTGKKAVSVDAFCSWRDGGISTSLVKETKKENEFVTSELTGILPKQLSRHYIPQKKLEQLLNRCVFLPKKDLIIKTNNKNRFNFYRKMIFALRTRKGKRLFRLFGITFYNEDK